jgi:2-amino-4-hydroxy-6-hydroxymethyldihydropteridine diphosphokinase
MYTNKPDMTRIYLALGSNVGNSKRHFARALELLKDQVSDIVASPYYVTRAVGYTEQADFVNGVIQGETTLTPRELLAYVKAIEKEVGRVERFRWGPREIDIDIIFYGNDIINEPGLHIPHERFRERDFVLRPLCDIAPGFIDPVTRQRVDRLLDELPPAQQSIKSKSS